MTIRNTVLVWSVTGNGAKGQRTWYLPDGLGSPLALVNQAGTGTAEQTFDPWGTAQLPSPSAFGFTGEWQGDASGTGGLVYLRARWYLPADGTFLSRDPFPGFTAMPYSQHPYQYGYSNPVSNTDPSGRCSTMGDNHCREVHSWEQLYAKYPYYNFRDDWEDNWPGRGWTPYGAETALHAYELVLSFPDRFVITDDFEDQIIRAEAHRFSEDFLGEWLILDDSVYYRRLNELQIIMEQCGTNLSNAFWLKYAAIGAAALGLGYEGPMYDADGRIGGGGGGVGAAGTSNLRGKSLLDDLHRRGETDKTDSAGVKRIYGEDPVEIFNNLADPGSIKPHSNVEGGLLGTLDGQGIGYRPYSTKSPAKGNPPTIDIGKEWKFKFLPGASQP